MMSDHYLLPDLKTRVSIKNGEEIVQKLLRLPASVFSFAKEGEAQLFAKDPLCWTEPIRHFVIFADEDVRNKLLQLEIAKVEIGDTVDDVSVHFEDDSRFGSCGWISDIIKL